MIRVNSVSVGVMIFAAGCGSVSAPPPIPAPAPALAPAPPAAASPATKPPSLQEAFAEVSSVQSIALLDAKVTVHRAYEYHGYSYIKPTDIAKLVAVDVEIASYRPGIDLDDIDFVDGDTNENFGSDPHITNLAPDGNALAKQESSLLPPSLTPLRHVLIHPVLKETKSIKLSYWDQLLTPEAIPLAEDGPNLPPPIK